MARAGGYIWTTDLGGSGPQQLKRGTLPSALSEPMTCTPALATISLPSHHHVRLSLEAQLRHSRALYSAVASEANRYQLLRLERLLREI